MREKYLVIVPTYNERDNLEFLIKEILVQGLGYNVLVVDDNSPDGTGQLADELAQKNSGRVFVLHRTGKNGLGTAYLEGFRFGLNRGYDYLFQMDADFSHQPRYLNDLLEAARKTGVAIGSRNIAGGDVVDWPWYRKLISRGGSFYSRSVLGLSIKDVTGGYKCFSRAALQILNLDENVTCQGFGFQIEVNSLCEWAGLTPTEVPIIFPDRVNGESKMSGKILLEALSLVWKLRGRKEQYQFAEPVVTGGRTVSGGTGW